MMGVKGSTKTSTAVQQVDLGHDDRRTISADQQAKFFGDQALGDIANKLSDPNWVDPSKVQRKVGESSLDKDAFMKLLLTQMKNQDPTNPLQSHEMAAQLAQFTSLEKLTNINEGIDSLKKAQQPAQNFDALNLIGKAVSGDSSKIERTDIKDSHAVTFNLGQDAQKATLTIRDSEGNVIRTMEANNLKMGRNEVTWNGKNDAGQEAPAGTYTVAFEGISSNGMKLGATTEFQGVITGVNFTPQGPILMIGKQSVALKDVKQIVDPALVRPAPTQKLEVNNPEAGAGGKTAPAKTPAATQVASNLDQIGMAQGLINRLNKEGAKAGGY